MKRRTGALRAKPIRMSLNCGGVAFLISVFLAPPIAATTTVKLPPRLVRSH